MEEDEEERDFSSDETAKIIEDDDMEDSPPDTPELWMPDRNDEDTNFVRGKRDAIPTKKYPESTSEVSIVQERKKLFKDMVRGGMETQTSSVTDKYLRDAVRDAIWDRNTVTFPDGKQWQRKQKWLAAPDPQAHEDVVRYLTYGCAFRLVDGLDKRYQTFQTAPGKYPTVWVCMCTRKCMASYDITDNNTSPMNDHLTNAHKLEKKMGHGRKAALSAHQTRLQKQETQATQHGMAPSRFLQLKVALFLIQTCQPFAVVDKSSFRDLMHKDWIPCAPETIRSTIGEIFLVSASNVKQAIKSAIDIALLPPFNINADLWTSKVTGEKFLGVRVFWKIGRELKSVLLAVTAYNPPKINEKTASEWLLEYIVAVLTWYGIGTAHVSGATSDTGPDCKKAFNVLAHKQHGWTWLWCVYVHTYIHMLYVCVYVNVM